MKAIKGKRIVLLIVMVILTVIIAANFAFAEDGLYQNIGEAAANSGDENFIQYRDNYYLDTQKISFFKSPMATVFDGMANGIFAIQKGTATVQISLFQMALQSNIIDLLEELITPFIDSMRVYIFDGFSLFFISLCALLLLLKLAVNRQAQAISGLFQILIVVALAFVFYNHPVEMMKVADGVTQGISDDVLQGPYNAVNGEATDASMEGKVSALIWNLMVHKPWQIAEFGSVSKSKTYEASILRYEPESDQRKELVEKLASEQKLFSKSSAYQLERIMILLVVGILNLIIFIFLTAFCVLIVGYRLLLLVYMMLGNFVFLLALIPYYSIELVKRWGYRILSACGTKILLAFFLSLLLVFMDAMYKFVDQQGLLFTMFMIIVIIAMLYIKRKEILGLFTGFRAGNLTVPGAYQSMNRALDRDLNMVDNLNSMNNMRRSDRSDQASYSTGTGESQRSTIKTARTERHAGEASFEPDTGMKEAAGSITRTTQDMSRYLKKAEDLLQKQYEKSKAESEESAERAGAEPKYGDFVRRTNAVRSLRAGQFDQRDISSVARILQRVEKNGGDADRVIVGNEKELHAVEVKRPASLFDRSNIQQDANSGVNEGSGQNESQKPSKRGIEFFKENFGEEKGEEFYSAMTRRYEAVTVDSFSSSDKLTYAQVQRQLKEREKEAKQNAEPTRDKAIKQGQKERQAVKMKKPGDEHGKEER